MPFVVVDDYRPGPGSIDSHTLGDTLRARSQLDLFSPAASARNGEL